MNGDISVDADVDGSVGQEVLVGKTDFSWTKSAEMILCSSVESAVVKDVMKQEFFYGGKC